MAQFSQFILTNNGQTLLAKMIAGTGNVEFTKVCTSSTVYTLAQIQELTALTNIQQTSLVSRVTRTNGTSIKVETAFSNASLTTGYYMRTLGLYALDPDAGEILYGVTIETSGNCYMPPYNNVTVTGAFIQLITTVGNSDNVSLDVDPGAYATIGDINALEAEIADLKAFIGYTDDDIYGVEVDFTANRFTRLAGAVGKTPGALFDTVNCFGGRRRCNLTDAGVVVAYYGDAGFSTTGALTQAVTVDDITYAVGTKVQVMVEQPKFYYKVVPLLVTKKAKGGSTKKVRYYVSDTPKAGFKLHPAFIENGKENDKIYMSAFEGTLYDVSASAYILDDAQVADFTVSTGDKLCSIANAKPISGKTQDLTRAKTRILAHNRGNGWEQEYAAPQCATQLLFMIEYASFNSQTAIGNGNVSKTDDGTNNMAENTGATITLGNASGAVMNTNNIQMVAYRGEENIWGDIWKWVDGINSYFDSTNAVCTLYVADHTFADDSVASPYEDTGFTPSPTNGYISAFCWSENHDWMFIPAEVTGNSSLPVGDYFYQSSGTGYRVALLGGGWYDGLGAGAFCWSLAIDSSTRSRDFGGRLVFIPSKAA